MNRRVSGTGSRTMHTRVRACVRACELSITMIKRAGGNINKKTTSSSYRHRHKHRWQKGRSRKWSILRTLAANGDRASCREYASLSREILRLASRAITFFVRFDRGTGKRPPSVGSLGSSLCFLYLALAQVFRSMKERRTIIPAVLCGKAKVNHKSTTITPGARR